MKKQELINDWVLFCTEQKEFTKDHFYTLLMDELSEEDIASIYRFLPNTERLELKLKKYLYTLNNSTEQYPRKKSLLEVLIRMDINERLPLFNKISEVSQFEFEYVNNPDIVDKLSFDDVLSQSFYDYTDFQTLEESDIIDALYNSLYGLVSDFDYRLYLFEPLLSIDYSGEYLFQFKKMGGVYAIKDHTVIYSHRE